MDLFFDMRFSTSLIPFLQCPIVQAFCIQSVARGNATILGQSIGHSKQKTVYVHVSNSEWFLRKSYLTLQEFGFGAQNCSSPTP
jgi:hypothetical protein